MYKKNIFIILFVFFATHAQAQLSKNTWISGGDGKFSSYRNESPGLQTSYYNDINISANIGYFIVDGFALGLKPGVYYSRNRSKGGTGTGGGVNRYLIGPFARYYFLNHEKQFNILVEATGQIGLVDFNAHGPAKSFSVYSGPVIYLNSLIGLEFLLGYTYNTEKVASRAYELTTKGFSAGIGFQIHLTK